MVEKYAVIIVDDEPAGRTDLKNILAHRSRADFNVIAEAATTSEALALLEEHREIDGLFLDINFHNENESAGFKLAHTINQFPSAPWIVFMTQYQQKIVDVIHEHPVYFLNKPMDNTEVDAALAWIRQKYPKNAASPVQKPTPSSRKRLFVRHAVQNRFNEREWHLEFIDLPEIIYIAKNQGCNTLKIRLADNRTLEGINGTIKDWADKYAQSGLVQIHRSHLVYLEHIRCLKPHAFQDECYEAAFKNCPDVLRVGPEYLAQLKKNMDDWPF